MCHGSAGLGEFEYEKNVVLIHLQKEVFLTFSRTKPNRIHDSRNRKIQFRTGQTTIPSGQAIEGGSIGHGPLHNEGGSNTSRPSEFDPTKKIDRAISTEGKSHRNCRLFTGINTHGIYYPRLKEGDRRRLWVCGIHNVPDHELK